MDNVLINVKDLSVSFAQAENRREVVHSISFPVQAAKTTALVGESGAGKSVTAHSILRLLPYPAASHPSGKIIYQNKDLLSVSEKEIRSVRGREIAMIFQEPMTSLNPLHPVHKQIMEIMLVHGTYSPEQAKDRVLQLLKKVELPEIAARPQALPHELSGGQRQRVMIAMALANSPKLLIADEPTTALDVTIQAEVLDLIKRLQEESGMALLLITHDLGIVRRMSDYCCVMKDGRIIEQGETRRLFKDPQQDYTRKLIESEPSGGPAESGESELLLQSRNLEVQFPRRKSLIPSRRTFFTAVKKADISIQKGRTLGLVGESGSGKTSLAMALMRLQKAAGNVQFQGRPILEFKGRALRTLRADLQMIFQDPFSSLNPRMTVAEIVGEGLRVHYNLSFEEQEKRIDQALRDVDLDPEIKERYAHEFSGGQRQRISIARALVLRPRLIILDEPTSSLDLSIQARIVELLRKLQKQYQIAYLFISHDLRVVKALSHDLAVMKDGEIVEYGAAAEIFQNPQAEYTRELLKAAFLYSDQEVVL